MIMTASLEATRMEDMETISLSCLLQSPVEFFGITSHLVVKFLVYLNKFSKEKKKGEEKRKNVYDRLVLQNLSFTGTLQ